MCLSDSPDPGEDSARNIDKGSNFLSIPFEKRDLFFRPYGHLKKGSYFSVFTYAQRFEEGPVFPYGSV